MNKFHSFHADKSVVMHLPDKITMCGFDLLATHSTIGEWDYFKKV